jgi:3-polyprenyl-4-hydroxybenzoate decarboxylase
MTTTVTNPRTQAEDAIRQHAALLTERKEERRRLSLAVLAGGKPATTRAATLRPPIAASEQERDLGAGLALERPPRRNTRQRPEKGVPRWER